MNNTNDDDAPCELDLDLELYAPFLRLSTDLNDLHDSDSDRKHVETDLAFNNLITDIATTVLTENNHTCYFDIIPNEIVTQIFQNLDLKDRCRATRVCRHWRGLFTDRSYYLDEVVVINLFEKSVWRNDVCRNAGTRINCNVLNDVLQLRAIFSHCSVASSVKLWFTTVSFAVSALRTLRDCSVRLKCLDLYPYGADVPLNAVFEELPHLPGMTMRPHGAEYFWKGLDLPHFPDFRKLDTLLLDSVNLMSGVLLPTYLTTLEWTNRGPKRFAELRNRLHDLVNLEYLLIGHADFDNPVEFAALLDTLQRLPRLQYLVFRFCKLIVLKSEDVDINTAVAAEKEDDTNLATTESSTPLLKALRVLKFDLCYGSLVEITDRFLTLTGFVVYSKSNLRILSINQISEDLALTDLYKILHPLERRSISLHFGLLQKSTNTKRCESKNGKYPQPPPSLRMVLGKLEASFVSDSALLETLFSASIYPCVSELKFVQCSAVTNMLLERISKVSPRLRKLSVIHCDNGSDSGMLNFIRDFRERISRQLQITWKRSREHPATLFLTLVNDHRHLIVDLNARFITKRFPNDGEGERIVVWDKSRTKALFIQDYSDSDRHRILGFALSFDNDV